MRFENSHSRSLFSSSRLYARCSRRLFGTQASLRSGHNRWSKIRHDKGKEDALKSKQRTSLGQELYIASKLGGPEPNLNARLAAAIANAKKGSLSKSSIESSIARGQGRSVDGVPLQSIVIEAMLPYGVAVVIECLTESKNRLLNDMRFIIGRNGGSLTPTAFMFDRKGKIWFSPHPALTVDDVLLTAIEAGALDLNLEDDRIVIDTEPQIVVSVARKLEKALGLNLERTEVVMVAKNDSRVLLNEDARTDIEAVLSSLEQEPSVQNLYLNIAETS